MQKKTQDESVEGQAVHVGAGGTNRKKQLLIALVVVGGVAVLIAGWFGLRLLQQDKDSNMMTPTIQTTTEVQGLLLAGKYEDAHKAISDALKDTRLTDDEEQTLYIYQGSTYENQKNYEAAMDSYRKAEAVKETLGAVQAIANLAVTMGNTELAIVYYKKAVNLIPQENNHFAEEQKRYFEGWVEQLENGQTQGE